MSLWRSGDVMPQNTFPGTLPGLSAEENAHLALLSQQLQAKTPRNLLRDAYYDAKRSLTAVSDVVPPQYNNLGLVLGWSAKAVDVLARRCRLETATWTGSQDLDSLGLSEVWTGNALGHEFANGVTSSLLHGAAFIVTSLGGSGEPPAVVQVMTATDATGLWNQRTRRLAAALTVIERDDEGNAQMLRLFWPGKVVTATRENNAWTTTVQTHPYGMLVEPMVYRPRTGRPFGSSRVSRPVMSLQDQAVRGLIRLEGHMDAYSWPELILLGADESAFRNADGTPKTAWQIMLGRVKGLPDDEDATNPRADVKQIPAADPAPHLANLNALAKLFARETSLPDSALAITDLANPTSAEAYDASQYELVAEAEGATDGWSAAISRSLVTALAIKNRWTSSTRPEGIDTLAPKWRNPRFLSRAQEADAGTKQLAAVPWLADTTVGLELLGLTQEQADRALAERRRAQGRQLLAEVDVTSVAPLPASPAVVTPPASEGA